METIYLARQHWIRAQCNNSDKIIDIGCNQGHIFAGWNRKNIVSVDIDDYSHMIENFVRADAHNLPFKDKEFDIAVLGEILEHVENPVQVLKEAKRVANKIIITVPNEYEWPPELNPFMSAAEAAKQQGLTIEEMAKRDNPAKEFYPDNYKHIFHVRYYTEKMLRKHLKEADISNYQIVKIIHDKFVFYGVICFV